MLVKEQERGQRRKTAVFARTGGQFVNLSDG
jgi:hypothetical protein